MNVSMRCFTEKERTQIHDISVNILKNVGVVFQNEQALKFFKYHGIKVAGEKVFIEEKYILKALETVSKHFEVTARNPQKSVIVGEKNIVCAPGCGSPYIMMDTGERRKGTLEDYINFCKLVHTSKHIDMTGYEMVRPSNIPKEHAYLYMMQANMVYSDKPFIGSVVPKQAAKDAIEMAGILWGGNGYIRDKYVILSTINPSLPLLWDENMAAAIVIYAKNNQPIILDNFVVPGATWPVTLVGNIVLRNAEILSGLVLAQIVNPGLPIIFGCSGGVSHMGNDTLSIQAPERSMFVSAIAQMAEFYGVQGRSGGNRTDAHIPNMQAGIESAISLYTAIKSGITFLLHSCGILGTYSSMSYEKFVIDEEIIAMVKRMMKPISISKQKIDLDRIGQVGIGEENLFDSKPFELCQDEHFQSKILNRLDYKVWEVAGKKGIPGPAQEAVKKRIESYEKPKIDRMSEKQISRFVEKRVKG